MLNSFGIDDWACLFGLVSCRLLFPLSLTGLLDANGLQAFVTAFNGIGLAVVHYGAGKHIEHVPTEYLEKWFMVIISHRK